MIVCFGGKRLTFCLTWETSSLELQDKLKFIEIKYYLPTEFFLKLPNKLKVNFAVTFPQPVGNMNNNGLAISWNINLTAEQTKEKSPHQE